MAAYVPSGKVGGVGIALLVGVGLGLGIAAGAIFHFVGRLFYLILLFPAVWGALLGAALAAAVRAGKCRSLTLAAVWGVLAPVASYAAYHSLENWHMRSQVRKALLKQEGATPEGVEEQYREALREEYGGSGFWAELALRAEQGMSIGRAGRSRPDSKPLITGIGMYVYWGIELAVMALISSLMAVSAARQPFCEGCQAWYEKKEVATLDDGRAPEGLRALARRDFRAFGASLGPGTHALSLERCPACSASPVRVVVEAVTQDKKGNATRKKVFDEMFDRAEANAFVAEALKPPAPPPA